MEDRSRHVNRVFIDDPPPHQVEGAAAFFYTTYIVMTYALILFGRSSIPACAFSIPPPHFGHNPRRGISFPVNYKQKIGWRIVC